MAWKHFNAEQMTYSATAKQKGIDNSLKGEYLSHADELVNNILDPLWEAWGSSIRVTSFYRCPELNAAVGGSKTSAHATAYAADLVPSNGKIEEFKEFVMNWLNNNKPAFDQYINEYKGNSSWVHIAVRNSNGAQRKQYKLYYGGKYYAINPLTFNGQSSIDELTGKSSSNSSISQVSNKSTNEVSSPTSSYQIADSSFNSTTNTTGYGQLTGNNVYLAIDLDAIKSNDVFVKDADGNPIIDPVTGDYAISDMYLLSANNENDEDLDVDSLPPCPGDKSSKFLEGLEVTEETAKGVQVNSDGTYTIKQSKTFNEIVILFMQWWELVQTLKRSCDNIKDTKISSKRDVDDIGNEQVIIDATVIAKTAFDKFGRAIKNGIVCPVCGKHFHQLPIGGYCSTECMMKDAITKSTSFLMAPNDKYKEFNNIINEIVEVLNQTTLLLNAITMLPDIIKEIAVLPDMYKIFVKNKIAEGFCELQVLLNRMMIKKDYLLKQMLRPIKLGIIAKPIASVFVAIQAITIAMKAAQQAFDIAYSTAMAIISKLTLPGPGGLGINAESFAWSLTPRSFISPKPYTCPDAAKIFVNLPGGAGLQSINFMSPLNPSAMATIDFSAMDTLLQSAFPPLTPIDYYLEPELFKVRYLFSDQGDVIFQIRQQLEDLLHGGPDYIPKFENLLPIKKFTFAGEEIWLSNLGYLWFLLGLFDAWGPHSESMVGSILNPAI